MKIIHEDKNYTIPEFVDKHIELEKLLVRYVTEVEISEGHNFLDCVSDQDELIIRKLRKKHENN